MASNTATMASVQVPPLQEAAEDVKVELLIGESSLPSTLSDADINLLGANAFHHWGGEGSECASFIRRYSDFKPIADAVEKARRLGLPDPVADFNAQNEAMGQAWQDYVATNMQITARSQGFSSAEELTASFVNHHISSIEALKYELTEQDKAVLSACLARFYQCDVGPAPFSLIDVAKRRYRNNCSEDVISCSAHMRAMATHWLRHPPQFFTMRELEELVVLSLFHDVYYYDDFVHHDSRILKDLGAYLLVTEGNAHSRAAALINSHLKISEEREEVESLFFCGNKTPSRADPVDAQLEALKQEWVQVDWYLSTTAGSVVGQELAHHTFSEGIVCLPLAFFHHHLGRFFTMHRCEQGGHVIIERRHGSRRPEQEEEAR